MDVVYVGGNRRCIYRRFASDSSSCLLQTYCCLSINEELRISCVCSETFDVTSYGVVRKKRCNTVLGGLGLGKGAGGGGGGGGADAGSSEN